MAVAKDRMAPSNTFMLEGSSTPSSPLHFLNLSSLSSTSNFYIFEDDNYPKQLSPHGDQDDDKSPSPPLSSSSSANYSNGFGAHHEADFGDHCSLLNYGGASLVNFQPQGTSHNFGGADQQNHDEYNPMWEDSSLNGNDHNHLKVTSEWLYDDDQESPTQQHPPVKNKRNLMEDDNLKTNKKQCTSNGSSSKKQPSKSKSSTITSKDPQSVAAKNRRERISERLKILQELVPNGSKVDMVTMLDKAISYVKFLQLQAKVLATDEFWPAAGGKPPNISQVKEAIDAILRASQRDSPSSSIQ